KRGQGLALAPYLGFADDLSRRIDHANAAPFQRDIDRGIVLHGCPSNSMLGADPRTPFHHHREGQPPSGEGQGGSPARSHGVIAALKRLSYGRREDEPWKGGRPWNSRSVWTCR